VAVLLFENQKPTVIWAVTVRIIVLEISKFNATRDHSQVEDMIDETDKNLKKRRAHPNRTLSRARRASSELELGDQEAMN